MENVSVQRHSAIRPLKTALTALICLLASTNLHLDAAQPVVSPKPVSTIAASTDPTHVLSDKDADLYRAAFAAQETQDWQKADAAIAQIKDKRLVGHILADRYEHRAPTIAEARQWLTAYADMPEAQSVYDSVRAPKGTYALPHPVIAPKWANATGGNLKLVGFRTMVADAGEEGKDSRRAAALFYRGDTDAARPLAHKAASTGVPLGLWIDGLAAWKAHDFINATRSFASLAQAPGLSAWDKSAASYWAFRAAKKTGDTAQAQHWLAEAAKNPTSFYGYMAASMNGHASGRSWKMPELSDKNIATLSQNKAGWQALGLVQIGRNDMAEDELRRMDPDNHPLQTAALALAEKARMPLLSMQLGGMATNENGQTYQAALYPLPAWQPTSGFKVDRALMFALIRHESQFDPDAVSGSGACGLMQIMPSTARGMDGVTAKHAGNHCPDPLFDPATNMEMGQRYVRTLADQPMIGDNLLLLLAAYNGGPGNVAHWLDDSDRKDPLLFLESLPLRETHDYVQQVMLQYWMYRTRLAEPENSAAQLANGQWPRYALRDTGTRHAETATSKNVKVASIYP